LRDWSLANLSHQMDGRGLQNRSWMKKTKRELAAGAAGSSE
jgi:hypothetical protein